MMKNHVTRLMIVSIFLISLSSLQAQQPGKYSRVKVYAGDVQVKKLLLQGVSLDEPAEKTSSYFVADLSSYELSVIRANKLRTEIIVDDLSADFIKRNEAAQSQADILMRTGGTPPGFSYGSMGGYLTFDEMVAELDEMKSMYPNLITTKSSIGSSTEGRNIWMVKISDNPNVEEIQEPGVLYSGLHHAREPISMANLIYFMQYILSKYGTDPEITCLINNRELYFVPCANPDGYVYNQSTNPNGGGFWRKNRRNNGDGSFGVDLNRNYEYNWGYDNFGSSPIPASEDYRGPFPASEPEVIALRNFITSSQLSMALTHHSYSDLLLLPFGYNNVPTSNEVHYRSVAGMLTYDNKYPYGRTFEMLGYNSNGRTDDWLHGAMNITAFTPETGSPADGFWPTLNRIIPICEQNLEMNISAAWAAGKYIKPRIDSNLYVSGYSYNLPVYLTNYGNTLGTTETVQLSFTDNRIQSYNSATISANGLSVDATYTVSRNITFKSTAIAGPVSGNFIISNSEGCVYTLPFTFNYAPDGCFPVSSSWQAVDIGSPGLAGSSCYLNGVYTIKGSGIGLGSTNDKAHMMNLANPDEVEDIEVQVLTVQNTGSNARAGISIADNTNPGSKRVSILVNPSTNKVEFQLRSSNNGNITTTIPKGNNTGSVPVWLKISRSGPNYYGYYSTNGTSWTQIGKHKVTLSNNRTAGLIVTSGSNSTLHTATFSNLEVTLPGGIINRSSPEFITSMETGNKDETRFVIYPNPSKGTVGLIFPESGETQTVKVFDTYGRQVFSEAILQSRKTLNLSQLSNGVYFIQYINGTKTSFEKLVINR